ncbi:MAG: MFS transporter, partial [Phycisphaerales bacterium JB038]
MSQATSTPPARRLDRKEIFGWAMFDFANSSFTTVMITAYFGAFFKDQIVGEAGNGSTLWGAAMSLSQLLVILTAPLLGALADFSGAKKKFLLVTYLGCSLGTMALGLAGPGDIALAMLLFIAANVFYSSGENFVSAFLPEIAPPEMMGRISSIAWGLGYFGGIGALLLSVFILSLNDSAHRFVWLMVGAWFLLAGLPTFLFVRERRKHDPMPPGQTMATIGFHRLGRTLRQARRFRQLFRFLITYMIFGCGVFAVVAFAGIIGKDMLGFSDTTLGIFLIVTNVLAAAGALTGGVLQDKLGSRPAIISALIIWLVAVALILVIEATAEGESAGAAARTIIWVVGVLVGLAMGATFAASRAFVGLLSPADRSAEFYGLWGLFGKLGYMIGPFVFGALHDSVGARAAILVLGVFFILGIVEIGRAS